MEVCPNGCFLLIMFAIPCISRTFRILRIRKSFRMINFLKRFFFIQRLIIQENFTGMVYTTVVIKPVTIDFIYIRIIGTKERVRQHNFPNPFLSFNGFPVRNTFRAFDFYSLSGSCPINNPSGITLSATRWIYPFPVSSGMNSNHIARISKLCGLTDCPERSIYRPAIRIFTFHRDMIFDSPNRTAHAQQGP